MSIVSASAHPITQGPKTITPPVAKEPSIVKAPPPENPFKDSPQTEAFLKTLHEQRSDMPALNAWIPKVTAEDVAWLAGLVNIYQDNVGRHLDKELIIYPLSHDDLLQKIVMAITDISVRPAGS